MSQIIDITKNKRPFVAALMCIQCPSRWYAEVVAGANPFRQKCRACGGDHTFGSILPDEYGEALLANMRQSRLVVPAHARKQDPGAVTFIDPKGTES